MVEEGHIVTLGNKRCSNCVLNYFVVNLNSDEVGWGGVILLA